MHLKCFLPSPGHSAFVEPTRPDGWLEAKIVKPLHLAKGRRTIGWLNLAGHTFAWPDYCLIGDRSLDWRNARSADHAVGCPTPRNFVYFLPISTPVVSNPRRRRQRVREQTCFAATRMPKIISPCYFHGRSFSTCTLVR